VEWLRADVREEKKAAESTPVRRIVVNIRVILEERCLGRLERFIEGRDKRELPVRGFRTLSWSWKPESKSPKEKRGIYGRYLSTPESQSQVGNRPLDHLLSSIPSWKSSGMAEWLIGRNFIVLLLVMAGTTALSNSSSLFTLHRRKYTPFNGFHHP